MRDISVFYAPNVNTALQYSVNQAVEATGLLKLSQRLILRLYTPLGSAAGRPEFGSNLLQELRTGKYRTTIAVQQAFAVARLDLLNQSGKDTITDDYDTLADIQLLSVRRLSDTVVMNLQITSRAGQVGEFPLVA